VVVIVRAAGHGLVLLLQKGRCHVLRDKPYCG
jgi:hypothetical protein